MELGYNLYALFKTLGSVQAVTLSTLLIPLDKNKFGVSS